MSKSLSIIVPCYNAEKYLTRCLDSLVNQTYNNLQIIVVNDGSTDNSQAIIDQYVEKYPRMIKAYAKPNGGIAQTRNFALDKVTSDYFGFLDSDDYCTEDMCFKMMNKAENEDSDVVVSNFRWIKNDSERVEKEGPYKAGKDMMVHLFATLWNKIYKTSFIKETGIKFPDGNRYEDACFLYCLCSQIKKISFIDEDYVRYVQLETSITHTNNNEVKNMITVFKIILDYYKEKGLYDDYHDELEYIHIKFFLGNSFLRSAQIKDKKDRKYTIDLGWNLLNEEFPNWNHNHYLKDLGGKKNKYFSIVRAWNIYFFAFIFRHLKKNAV